MTDKELHKLGRSELLELMVSLSEENDALRKQIENQKKQLADRALHVQETGSIAEASLKVSGVFEVAQDAANRYLENIRHLNEDTQKMADELLEQTQRKCAAMEAEAQINVANKWNTIKELLNRYCDAHYELKDQLRSLYVRCEHSKDEHL
jgi:chemotaxis regulatin CheY-phosphate phosphatase CheZ